MFQAEPSQAKIKLTLSLAEHEADFASVQTKASAAFDGLTSDMDLTLLLEGTSRERHG